MSNRLTDANRIRRIHRWVAVVAVFFAVFIATTGITLQMMDLGALLRHAPAVDPTMQAIREGIDGPPNFQVIRDADYSAPALPSAFDFNDSLPIVADAVRHVVGGGPIDYLELRMEDGRPVGQVASRGRLYRFDAVSGEQLGKPAKVVLQPLARPSLRNDIKGFHRMRAFGSWAILLDTIAGLTILVMVISGLTLYARLLQGRLRMHRKSPFWSAGGRLRSFHRGVGPVAGLFLVVIALAGITLSISSLGVTISLALHHGKRPAIVRDESSPMTDPEMVSMLHTTLNAYQARYGETPIKVLRVRYFAGMPQGVIITGGTDVRQVVFNTVTGHRAGLSEPNYPAPGQTFGWQVDETGKEIHRGDYFGLTGRWISLLSGFSLLFLAISGAVMYWELWRRRRKAGHHEIFWS